MELVSAFRHLQRAADMHGRSERTKRPQRHPAHAHAKAMPLTSKVVRTRFARRSGPEMMRRARARSMRLDPQASLGGVDHHVEKDWALPTGSGSSDVRTAASTAVPRCRRFDSWLRLAVKERRSCGGGRPEKAKSRKKQPSHLIQCCVLSHMGRFSTKNMDSSCG